MSPRLGPSQRATIRPIMLSLLRGVNGVNSRKLRFVLARQRGHHISGGNRFRALGLAGDAPCQVPQIFLVIERLRIEHVVSAVDFRLHLKKRFRIAGVGAQIGRHGGSGQEEVGEKALVGAD